LKLNDGRARKENKLLKKAVEELKQKFYDSQVETNAGKKKDRKQLEYQIYEYFQTLHESCICPDNNSLIRFQKILCSVPMMGHDDDVQEYHSKIARILYKQPELLLLDRWHD